MRNFLALPIVAVAMVVLGAGLVFVLLAAVLAATAGAVAGD